MCESAQRRPAARRPPPEQLGIERLSRPRSELTDGPIGWEGIVWTPHGAVSVLHARNTGQALFRFVLKGSLFRYQETRMGFSSRALARRARECIEAAVQQFS